MSTGEVKDPANITIGSKHYMALVGRFLEMQLHGNMMVTDFQPFLILGFNTLDKKKALTNHNQYGNMYFERSKSATLTGQLTNPATKTIINVSQVLTFVDNYTYAQAGGVLRRTGQSGNHRYLGQGQREQHKHSSHSKPRHYVRK